MPRIVLDTNVIVSAVISEGNPRRLLQKGIEKEFTILTSDLILKELTTVLRKPKFNTSEDEIRRIIVGLLGASEVVEVVSRFKAIRDDPNDNAILNTAHDGRADMIVTGDKHLLMLKNFKGTNILSVSEAMQQL
jgi:putative PIN family toxin of toxin-antitoxin system